MHNRRCRYLLDEEEPRLFAQFTGRLAHLGRLVTVAIGTGMRRGDQLNLRKIQVDFQRNVIRVPNSKTGRGYPVPMNEDVRRVISPEMAEALWKLLKEEARNEFESGHRAAEVFEPAHWLRDAWRRARYLAIRDSFIEQ